MYQFTYEQKKEKFINVLNNHFGSHDVFTEVANISDEDFRKIIELYEQKASVGGKDPWHYLYFDELIIMQQALYEVVKDNYRYSDITAKVEKLFEKELDRRLQRRVLSYGEETDETYKASYAEMPEYAMTLADMCVKDMNNDKKSFEERKRAIEIYQQIKKDFIKAGKQMPMSYEMALEYAQGNMARRYVGGTPKEPAIEPVWGAENNKDTNLSELHEIQESKTEKSVHPETEKKNDEIEQQKSVVERQQREIELLTLQQEINKIENEKIEIEKRIRQISNEALGSFFTKQVSEKYPTEYQTFKQQEEQVRSHRSSYAQIADLKEKFNEVSQDLQFYKGVLPVYESFYQRFEQIKTERKQVQVSEKEQERIYNLIYKAENERLKRSRSLYTAWDLGSKIIPPEYQGMTYEQVEEILNQKEAEEKVRQEEKAIRDELIGKAIRKVLNVSDDYHLSQIQIQNLSQQFVGYSDDELKEFISGKIDYIKKDIKQPSRNELISKIISMFDKFELNFIPIYMAEKKLNEMTLTKLEQLSESKSQCLDVLMPPAQRIKLEGTVLLSIPNYDGLSREDKIKYRNAFASFTNEQLFEQYKKNSKEKIAGEEKEKVQEEIKEEDKKSELINEILKNAMVTGEISEYSPLPDIKKRLMEMSVEELENTLATMQPQQEETISSGGIKR